MRIVNNLDRPKSGCKKMSIHSSDRVSLFGGPALHLSIELGFGRDDARMEQALSAFWSSGSVDGPWLDSGSMGEFTGTEPATGTDLVDRDQCGTLRVSGATASMPFALLQINEDGPKRVVDGKLVLDNQIPEPEKSAWLTVNLTRYQLTKQFHVDNTWTLRSQPWLGLVCDAFAEIVNAVHAQVPIASAAIGEETSGCFRCPTANRLVHADQAYPPLAVISTDVIESRGAVFVTNVLWRELCPDVDAVLLPSNLYYVKPRLDARLLGA
ncbi:hypothetical protein AAGS40_28395 (plasmid) [Paraburkholderia sp. PREW-6R]|uniref:hypothetical protein n=1 Tax=Paraburkholderia sp. PREW-6R TaxID=3141544 RepID=UPI0031F5737E